MDAIKLRSVLSSVLIELSDWEKELRGRAGDNIKGKGKLLLKELKRQVHFLLSFKYTSENIQNHFIKKAANFFGFDFDESDSKKMLKSKPSRRKKRLKPKGSGLKKRAMDRTGDVNFRKNEKKITRNFYRPLE